MFCLCYINQVIIDGRKAYIPTSAVAQIASTARPVDVSNMPDPVWPEPPGPRRGNGTWATMRVNNRVAYAPYNYMCHSGTVLGMIVMFINPICGAIGMVLGSKYMFSFIFSCDHAALRTLLSVRPFVTPFSQCSCHRIIIKFSGVITIDKSDVHAKGQGQRSNVKVTEVKTNFAPVWAFPDHYSSLNSQIVT